MIFYKFFKGPIHLDMLYLCISFKESLFMFGPKIGTENNYLRDLDIYFNFFKKIYDTDHDHILKLYD